MFYKKTLFKKNMSSFKHEDVHYRQDSNKYV